VGGRLCRGSAHRQEGVHLARGERRAQQHALPLAASALAQQRELLEILDALR
jgi:hypothetical protein